MNKASTRILVVDDDNDLRDLLHQYLSRECFEVHCACDGAHMDTLLIAHSFDIIILDLMMPHEDGLSILRRIRPSLDTPVIILSAKGQDTDRIIGLEVGADDYLAKPFNPRELLARIRALLRRCQPVSQPAKLSESSVVHFGLNQFDTTKNELSRDNKNIKLTDSETQLLRLFIDNSESTLSRDTIMDALRGRDRSPFDRSIDIHITRLRKKVETDPTNPKHIRTVWAKGYKFTPDTAN